MKKCIVLLSALLTAGLAKAQTGAEITLEKKELMHTTWYESPRESSHDTIAFRLSRHVHVPGKDDPSVTFSSITFNKSQEFTVEAWRWCSKNPAAYGGKWTFQPPLIRLDFVKQKCRCQLTMLTIEKELLKVVIKEM